jgi:anti-sigma-K factor RskA
VNAEAHRAYRDELAAYSIGALEPAEVDQLERHVSGCRECREYLFWLDPAVDLLPASVEQHQAPRRLKRALMAEVHEDLKAARRAERERERAERGIWGSIWRPATAIAACLVLVAGIVGGYALRGNDESQPELITAEVVGNGVGARMAATLEREGDRGILHVEALPSLPENRVYQAWIQRDGAMEPSTAFVVGRDGTTEVAIKGTLDGASGIYVTREPAGGSEEPTPPVLMKAPLA